MGIGGVVLVIMILLGGTIGAANAAGDPRLPAAVVAPPSRQFDLGESRDDMAYFLGPVIDDVNAYWAGAFANADIPYTPADWAIVVAGYSVPSHCGGSVGDPAEGDFSPAFYCPAGGEHPTGTLNTPIVYLSAPWLFNEIAAVGATDYDFAIATIVAHELGHHVEHELGYLSDDGSSFTSKQIELAADCFSGVWAEDADAAGQLDVGDIDEAVAVSYLSGSDFPSPEGTPGDHGTRDERVAAWSYGFQSGTPADCLTTYLPDKSGLQRQLPPQATASCLERRRERLVRIATNRPLGANKKPSPPAPRPEYLRRARGWG